MIWPLAGLAVLLVAVSVVVVVRVGQSDVDDPTLTSQRNSVGAPSTVDTADPMGSAAPDAPLASAGPAPSATPAPSGAVPSRANPTAPAPNRSTAKPPTGAKPASGRFTTLPPGSALPSGQDCAARVRATPYPENKGGNARANATVGHKIGSDIFSGADAKANARIAPRVDGQFTGTTGQILRWAACKWGIDEEMVFAQAAIESWWRQDTMGDWTNNASLCAPGRGLGVDGKAGQCPESFGVLQNRYPFQKSAWPGISRSTAMSADLGYAIWRACFEGYESWLNTVERGRQYGAGDAWGCMGRWFSGRWYTAAGDGYVSRVRGYLNQRIWTTRDFQQP